MEFDFWIGGFRGPCYSVYLREDQLVCERFYGEYCSEMDIEPLESFDFLNDDSIHENPEWKELVAYLATRKWKGDYSDHDTVDGTSWSLVFRSESITIEAGGSNGYPKGFFKFLRLLNKVLPGYNIR